MKRAFTRGSGTDRKIVVVELDGNRVTVIQKKPDGTAAVDKKDLKGEAEARASCEKVVRQLLEKGFEERPLPGSNGVSPKSASAPTAKAAKPAKPARPKPKAEPELEADEYRLRDLVDEEPVAAAPLLPRVAPASSPAASEAPKKKKAGGKTKKKKKGSKGGDELDKRVLAGVGAAVLAGVLFLGYIAYDAFLKPPTIVGVWAGSMIDFEIGQPMVHSEYRLVLDGQKRASLTREEKFTSVGTYTLVGDRLKLSLVDEDDKEPAGGGDPEPDAGDGDDGGEGAGDGEGKMAAGAGAVTGRSEPAPVLQEYKIKLGRSTLDLYDPETGKQMVQLIRFREEPVIGGGTPAPEAPTDAGVGEVAGAVGGDASKEADAKLVSVEFVAKDNAFKLRYPPGWETDSGSRPDNTYSWGSFEKGSASIKVYADIQGSLMSGSDAGGQYEEGSPLAPVHRAHEMYQRTASEEYSNYREGKPALFKGASLREGRIAAFTASGGGLFGSSLKGYRVTLLTNDRRISILCHCPDTEFEKFKPTFLALCRSLSR